MAAAVGMAAAVFFWWSGTHAPGDTATVLTDPLQASVEIPAAFLESQEPDLNEVLALDLSN